MMINMGTHKKLVACLDIGSRETRKDALGSIADMLTEILVEEDDYLREVDGDAPDFISVCVRHSSGFLISALDSIQTALEGFEPIRPMPDNDDDDGDYGDEYGIPF